MLNGFLHQTPLKSYTNQQAIISVVSELARTGKKGTLTYVRWECGLGKTSSMLELGHCLGLTCLPSSANRGAITVHLVLANADLVEHYTQLFSAKQAQADRRVTLHWVSMTDFKKQLIENPGLYNLQVVVSDKGDVLLEQKIMEQLNGAKPKHLVLLSAVERD